MSADARTPGWPRAADVLDDAMRTDLAARLDDAGLTALLDDGDAAGFDAALLDRARGGEVGRLLFDPAHHADRLALLADSPELDAHLAAADAVVRDRRFPLMVNYADFTAQEPDAIDWRDPIGSDHPEYAHTLNRHSFWHSTAVAAAATGDPVYLEDLRYQLASWSLAFPDADGSPTLNLLDASTRAQNWTKVYPAVLGLPGWTAADNALFLHKLAQTGEVIHAHVTAGLGGHLRTNKGVVAASALLTLGHALDDTGWRDLGRNTLIDAADAQFRPDGSHVEQAPNYAFVVVERLLNAALLDRRGGEAWDADELDLLRTRSEAAHLFVHPTGDWAAVGDSFRQPARIGLLAREVFGGPPTTAGTITNAWPARRGFGFTAAGDAVPRRGDLLLLGGRVARVTGSNCDVLAAVWLAGEGVPDAGDALTNVGPDAVHRPRFDDVFLVEDAATLASLLSLPDGLFRGTPAPAVLPDAGAAALRDVDGGGQVLFDAGPHGSSHGHFDLLGIDLVARGRPLVPDAGLYTYDDSDQRRFARSTPAHNTPTVDGLSHRLNADGDARLLPPRPHAGGTLVAGSHRAYDHLAGSPVVSRALWHDGRGRLVVVDRFAADAPHDYAIGYNLPADARLAADGTAVAADLRVRTIALGDAEADLRPTWVTHTAALDPREPAWRLETTARRVASATFVTLIDWSGRPAAGLAMIASGGHSDPVTISLDGRPLTIPAVV